MGLYAAVWLQLLLATCLTRVSISTAVLGTCTARDLQRFSQKFSGKIQVKGQNSFDPYALLWNKLMYNAGAAWKADIPSLIVYPKGESDVQKAVKLAIKCGVKVSPVGGGHAYGGTTLVDNAILVVLSSWKKIKVDSMKQTATIQPGVKAGELFEVLKDKGLFFPVGHCSDVGLAGFLLGGGAGWNLRTYGSATESIISVKAVDLRNGQIIRVDSRSYSDLFWGLRGAGMRLTVVLEFKLQLYPYPYNTFFRSEAIFSGVAVHPAMEWYREWEKKTTIAMEPYVIWTSVPGVVGTAFVVSVTAFYPLDEETHTRLEELKVFADIKGAIFHEGDIPFDGKALFTNFDTALQQPGTAVYNKYRFYDHFNQTLMDKYQHCAEKAVPGSRSVSWVLSFREGKGKPGGGVLGGIYSNKFMGGTDAVFTRTAGGSQTDQDAQHVQWVRDCIASFEPFTTPKSASLLVNAHMFDEPNADERLWGKQNLVKLKKIKAKYDPYGVLQPFGFYKPQFV